MIDRDTVIDLMRKAWPDCKVESTPLEVIDRLVQFSALVTAAEREECARVVENYCGAWNDEGYALAADIRSRK